MSKMTSERAIKVLETLTDFDKQLMKPDLIEAIDKAVEVLIEHKGKLTFEQLSKEQDYEYPKKD